MNRLWIPNFMGLLIIGMFLVGFAGYDRRAQEEFETVRLSIVINYASDAAVEDMLLSDDLNMDYTSFGKVTIDPQRALDTFVEMFCLNYGMSITEENKVKVRTSYMPAFAVATYDGYYLATPEVIKSATAGGKEDIDVDLAFSPKMPYTYEVGNYAYALNLNGKDAMRLDLTNKTLTKSTLPTALRGANSYGKVIANINSLLTNRIGMAIARNNDNEATWSNTFYLPAALTSYSRVNPITGPSVIALVQNVDITTPSPIHSFSIAGSRLQPKYQVVCYTRTVNGVAVKYYCYVNQVKPGANVIEYANSPEDAAVKGYAADVEYLTS